VSSSEKIANINLVFAGERVDPNVVTQKMGVQPDIAKLALEEVPVGFWTFSGADLFHNASDIEALLDDWAHFLSAKAEALESLNQLRYNPYLEIKLPADSSVLSSRVRDVFIDTPLIKELGASGIALNVWFVCIDEEHEYESDAEIFEIEISRPRMYLSRGDRENFFHALDSIKAVTKVEEYRNGIVLHHLSPTLDDESLRDLIAVMTRYQLPMSVLKVQCTEQNAGWFRNEGKFWFSSVFD